MSLLSRAGGAGIRKNRIISSFINFLGNKRQKFIISVLILSIGLFIAEYILGRGGIILVFILSFLTSFFLYFALRNDFRENFSPQALILPFFYSLAIGLFYLLVPARFITRIGMTFLYALGLYSLFLSENIFAISSVRTIQLLSGARTVSLVLTMLSYFFISNVVFSFHINVFLTLILIFLYTFPMLLHAFWTYTLEKNLSKYIFWVFSLSICLVEVAAFLWFSLGSPTVIALFLTAICYVVLGLAHAWLEKRLFRSVILEYFWVTIISFIFLILFTG
ncbi:MAG: hypothetical protein COU25_01920 [Candidatus Levybacteria bacterium CG10_big_fil_rev_8_21_14_0_10_35_13]|nr:MAG: hypothetical protein COU25_01920 [Candidatus Levybacteria bacterium CG10_big_fil_rev_8_21_14_0_10_35_13]